TRCGCWPTAPRSPPSPTPAAGRPRARSSTSSVARTVTRPGRTTAPPVRCPIRSRPPTAPARSVAAMTIDAKLDAIGIVVADMAKSLAFYRALGLPIPDGVQDAPHVEVPLGGGLRLLFDTEETVRSFHPSWSPAIGAGRIGLAVSLPDAAAVDAAYAELTAAGYHGELEPFDAFWGQRYASVNDPDGNTVDLYAPLAR